jgi:hypothetical protein
MEHMNPQENLPPSTVQDMCGSFSDRACVPFYTEVEASANQKFFFLGGIRGSCHVPGDSWKAAAVALDAGRDIRDVCKLRKICALNLALRHDDWRRDVAVERDVAANLAGRRDAEPGPALGDST